MKRRNIFKIAMIYILAITANNSFGQTTIYSEGFTDQENKGAIGPEPNLDLTGVDWSVDISATDLSTDSDWFKVTDGVFEARNLDGDAIWLSKSITISDYTNISFSLSAAESGTLETQDIFKTEYKIDSGAWTVASTNGDLSDDFDTLTVTQTELNGSTLQIRVIMKNNADTEYLRLDNIIIQGILATSEPTITFNNASSNQTETDATFATNGIPITFTNYDTNVTVTATINGSSTSEAEDYTIDLTPLVFDANETLSIPLSINDDADLYNETIIIDISVTSGTATLSISQHVVNITDDDIWNIIINEILADPAATDPKPSIDSNGDSNFNSSEDEFIELVNLDNKSHLLTGYTISDGTGVKHTFGAISIPAGGSVVVFGGGTPTEISGITDTANGLSLNNAGDTITLKNSEGALITTYTYGNEGDEDQSIGRNNDLTGGFVKHSEISSNPVAASPGRYNSSGQPFSMNTWTGATDNSWTTASNWSLGIVPGTEDDIQILKATSQPTASSAVTVNSVIINSGTSLIAESTFSGTATYKRNLPTENSWYFISSPVDGETIQNLISNHTFLPSNSVAGRIGIAPYDNIQAISAKRWAYQTTSSTGDLEDAKGYSVQLDEVRNISFSGTIRTDDSNADIPLILGGVNGTNFNLVGNPYTSYINSTTFLTTQSNDLEPNFYMWNGSYYDTRSTGSHADFMIAPGQGFFVEAKTANTVTFVKSNQNHNATNTFQKSNSRPEIKLLITDNISSRYADIYYINGTTTGFDNGYDGKLFGGVPQPFAIYTHLVSDSEGKNFQIQSLPTSNYENMIIPIGINSASDKDLTFSAETSNLPNELKVFLEDRLLNTFTSLEEANSTYKITLSEAIKGIGRFYLHTSTKSPLITNSSDLKNISIYKTNNHNLRIVGLSHGKTKLKLFNILSRQVLISSFTSNGIQDISLPKVAAGIYIVQIETETGKLNKKITLE
ncbi:hypothetical protein BST83_02365 [Polaribacter filamentus]|uniref:LTD domain-containing protein n=1 Tax=Polaribacter filamentus TaxID=53483 RepID=A0A2S7KU46_9FLAO|nr:lamin tail domain-containing protein [Polaribacter filamentus]PQB06155.1 hypothetical protein BST83_02365 [Polaribacter filamentus]